MTCSNFFFLRLKLIFSTPCVLSWTHLAGSSLGFLSFPLRSIIQLLWLDLGDTLLPFPPLLLLPLPLQHINPFTPVVWKPASQLLNSNYTFKFLYSSIPLLLVQISINKNNKKAFMSGSLYLRISSPVFANFS